MSLGEEVGMKTGSRKQLLSEGLSGEPGNVSRLKGVNKNFIKKNPHLNIHLVSPSFVNFKGLTNCHLSNTTHGEENRKPFASKFSDLTIDYFKQIT